MTGARTRDPLPAGVELYSLAADGTAVLVHRGRTTELGSDDGFVRFIDDGQRARYFIGDQATSPQRPTNATFKLGVVRPHSAFTPHAHRAEHFVLSLGYAACGIYDAERQAAVEVRLPPGTMIRIPALLPHSFANRARQPLLVLAANTGYGTDHEDYAITAAEAERRAAGAANANANGDGDGDGDGDDYPALAKALRELEIATQHPAVTTWPERVAAQLRRLATRLEAAR